MDLFGIKKAIQYLVDDNQIKMESTDFKTHLFYKSKNNFTKPIVHEIRKSIGKNVFLHLTYEEFKDKFGENKFYIYE